MSLFWGGLVLGAALGASAVAGWSRRANRRLLAALREKGWHGDRQRFGAEVFAHAHDAVMLVSAKPEIIDVNDAFTRITGYSRDEVQGRDPHILSSGRQDAEFFAEFWSRLRHEGHWEGELWNRRKDGELYAERLAVSVVRGGDGRIRRYVALFSDVTERKCREALMFQEACFDPLTRLANRRLLAERFVHLAAIARRSGRLAALLFVDLDRFKQLNDSHGHDAGDALLVAVAERLKAGLREIDTLARLGGDEFVVLLGELSADPRLARAQATLVGSKIVRALGEPHHLPLEGERNGGRSMGYRCPASVGVAMFSGAGAGLDVLLRQADAAMYRAKAAGGNRLCFAEWPLLPADPARPGNEPPARTA